MAETAAAPAELRFADARLFRELLGQHDEHVKALERQVGVRIDVADSTLTLHGDPLETELVSRVLLQLYGLLESGYPIYPSDVDYALRILSSDRNAKLRDIFLDTVFISAHKRVITPKSVAQKEYIDAIRNFDIVFGIGPAGTGKCVAGSSLVLTTRGLVPIAALGEGTAPGEYRPIDLEVASLSGRARASHVYNGGHSRTLRLRTRLGREIEVTPEHPLLRLRTDGVSVWQRAEELRTGDHVAVQRGQAMFGGDAAEITAIEEGEADVYDLTVPGSHSFCANGFVNHNTYLAMAMAVAELMKNSFSRIILTRPAVEAGEKLGFLPGDLAEKVNPYLRPLYDALHDMVDFDRARRMVERGTIEVAPLGFMRGRAQPVTSRVLTHLGWRHIGELVPGDYVIGSDGRATQVLGVYPQGEKEVFRVTATDRASTRCCADHLWAVLTPEDRWRGNGPRVLTLREMLGRLRTAHPHRFELPMLSAPVRFAPCDMPLDPYALGLLLGDGCLTGSTTPAFATGDAELACYLESSLEGIEVAHETGVDYVLRHRGGVRSNTKFVPPEYLFNAPDVRLAVLQGLLDTDGRPVVQDSRSCRIQFCTTSSQLRTDVVFLVRSLGGVAYWRTRAAAGRKPGRANGRDVVYRSDAYVVDIRVPAGVVPFRLGRKAEKYAAMGGGRPMRFIKSVEPAGAEECVCIRVAAPDSLYVTDDFLLTHNTLNDSFVILDEAQNTTTEQMKMFLTRLGYGSKAVVTGDVTQIDLPAGKASGLKEAAAVLRAIRGIRFITFTERDVVRHPLVQEIITAYDRAER